MGTVFAAMITIKDYLTNDIGNTLYYGYAIYAYSALCAYCTFRQGHVEYYRKANANRKNSYTNMHTIIIPMYVYFHNTLCVIWYVPTCERKENCLIEMGKMTFEYKSCNL